jgi:Cu/Ag efflux protein CusF
MSKEQSKSTEEKASLDEKPEVHASTNSDSETKPEASSTNKQKLYIYIAIAVVAVLLIAGGGFWYFNNKNASTADAANAQSSSFPGFGGARGPGGPGGAGAANFSQVRGTVKSIDGKNLVVTSSDNSGDKIVLLSDTTKISKTNNVSKDQVLASDQSVQIQTSGTDGNLQAVKITKVELPGGQNQSRNTNRSRPAGAQNGQAFGGNADRTRIIGTIKSFDDKSVTVTAFNQNETTVNLQSSTVFAVQADGAIADLKTGQTIQVVGATTSGVTSATNITIQ